MRIPENLSGICEKKIELIRLNPSFWQSELDPACVLISITVHSVRLCSFLIGFWNCMASLFLKLMNKLGLTWFNFWQGQQKLPWPDWPVPLRGKITPWSPYFDRAEAYFIGKPILNMSSAGLHDLKCIQSLTSFFKYLIITDITDVS